MHELIGLAVFSACTRAYDVTLLNGNIERFLCCALLYREVRLRVFSDFLYLPGLMGGRTGLDQYLRLAGLIIMRIA